MTLCLPTFGLAICCLAPYPGQHERSDTMGSSVADLTTAQASAFARLALKGIQKEYPNKPEHVMNGPADVKTPALHPAFYGCYDWHSGVHGHWMLVYLVRHFPDLPEVATDSSHPWRAPDRQELAGRGGLFPCAGHQSFDALMAGPGC